MATNGATQNDIADVNELTAKGTEGTTPYFLRARMSGDLKVPRSPSLERVLKSDPLICLDQKGELSPRLKRNDPPAAAQSPIQDPCINAAARPKI